MKRIPVIIMAVVMVCMACKSNPADAGKEAKKMSEPTKKSFSEPKQSTVDTSKKYTAVIKTSKGDITVELYPKEAPLSVTNFKQLADGGFYNGLTFHRVVPNFVVQGGDPEGTGAGGPGYTIPAEINPAHKHVKGALAWARTGDEVNPERRSSGSQFYITLAPTPFLDGGYTVFGKTTGGMDVVEKIQIGDKIEKVEVKAE
jgi:peptidyl-prolyl cis-trans isomerase B (cyclophilin B)